RFSRDWSSDVCSSDLTQADQIIWLSWHCKYVPEEGVIYATAKNITEEKKLRELAASASQLSKIGGWEIDLIANTIFWSKMVHERSEERRVGKECRTRI